MERDPRRAQEHFRDGAVRFRGGGRKAEVLPAGAGGGPRAAPRWFVAAAGHRRAPFRFGMATAAAGGGQEKQLAPTLLSFFIYNPKLGPKEGEVPEGWGEPRGRGAARPVSAEGPEAAGLDRPAPKPSGSAYPPGWRLAPRSPANKGGGGSAAPFCVRSGGDGSRGRLRAASEILRPRAELLVLCQG